MSQKTEPYTLREKLLPKDQNLDEILSKLELEMRTAADMLDFERAMMLRDQIKELEKLKQEVHSG